MVISGIANKVVQTVVSRKIADKIYPVVDKSDPGYVVEITKVVWVPTKYPKAIGYDRYGRYTFDK
jgi:hypothetical protein